MAYDTEGLYRGIGGPFAEGFNSLKNFSHTAFTVTGAQSVENLTERFQNPLLGRLFQFIIIAESFVGIILVVVIVYGGFLYMTSRGNEEQIGKAQQYLTNGVIGLIILLGSYSATVFVINALVGATT